jgi:hypothetical protein
MCVNSEPFGFQFDSSYPEKVEASASSSEGEKTRILLQSCKIERLYTQGVGLSVLYLETLVVPKESKQDGKFGGSPAYVRQGIRNGR